MSEKVRQILAGAPCLFHPKLYHDWDGKATNKFHKQNLLLILLMWKNQPQGISIVGSGFNGASDMR